MTRILLFILTNIAVLFLASVIAHVLGLDQILAQKGIHFGALLAMGAVFGFAGSFISLLMSKWTAKRAMGVRVITTPANREETWLVETVRRQASEAGIGMPEVGIFDTPELNAFATGASRNHALVAVSSGLLARMSASETEAVIGHEITHVANGDMITLTLLQGVVNTFVFALARAIGAIMDRDDRRGGTYFIVVMVTQLLLGFLASMIVMWFSRQREFRADAGGARLAGREKMIDALRALQRNHPSDLPTEQLAAFGISGGTRGSFLKKLFLSHPPLAERIEALQRAA